jgi:diguanylate cyclase (GGDEF)-like protein
MPGQPDDPADDAYNGAARSAHPEWPPAGDPDDRQSLADSEQTLADSDQTLSDADQTSSDSDQTSADTDQLAADRDQAASDRDLASGVDPREHDLTRDIRRGTARRREQTAQARLDAGAKRDATAHARDLAALARDRAADARDLALAQLDAAAEQELDARVRTGVDVLISAAGQRKRAAQDRARAAEQRVLAADDRSRAARDREEGARGRRRALADRKALTRQLAIAETDPLTAARTRAAGLIELERELDRAQRTSGRLVVAYVDVVGLKALNDSEGHSAGDELLKGVVALIRAHLRSFDLMVRLGGDEFLCAMSNLTLPDARQRFSVIAAALAAAPGYRAITTGFAELTADDTVTKLIARADGELMAIRRCNRESRPDPAVDPSADRPR